MKKCKAGGAPPTALQPSVAPQCPQHKPKLCSRALKALVHLACPLWLPSAPVPTAPSPSVWAWEGVPRTRLEKQEPAGPSRVAAEVQYSRREKSMDRGPWRATICRAAKLVSDQHTDTHHTHHTDTHTTQTQTQTTFSTALFVSLLLIRGRTERGMLPLWSQDLRNLNHLVNLAFILLVLGHFPLIWNI